jgi:hypothetical protein
VTVGGLNCRCHTLGAVSSKRQTSLPWLWRHDSPHVLGLHCKTRLISPCGRTKRTPLFLYWDSNTVPGTQLLLLIYYTIQSLRRQQIACPAIMMPQYYRNAFVSLELFAVLAQCANLNYSGEAITTRYWDCCKPSCAWPEKAEVNKPVLSCTADNKPTDIQAGTACGTGGTAFGCSNQQPWAVNDTFSYGFAGAWIMPNLMSGIEGGWCCACYQLDFTSDPLRGKTLIVQASNSAYDVTTTNRFSLAVRNPFFHHCTMHKLMLPDTWWKHHFSECMCAAVWREPERVRHQQPRSQ